MIFDVFTPILRLTPPKDGGSATLVNLDNMDNFREFLPPSYEDSKVTTDYTDFHGLEKYKKCHRAHRDHRVSWLAVHPRHKSGLMRASPAACPSAAGQLYSCPLENKYASLLFEAD